MTILKMKQNPYLHLTDVRPIRRKVLFFPKVAVYNAFDFDKKAHTLLQVKDENIDDTVSLHLTHT